MATRLYLTSIPHNTIAPSFASDWDRTTNALRLALSPIRLNSPLTTPGANYSEVATTASYDVLFAQFISPPLTSQVTISGTVAGQIRVSESSTNADFCRALTIKVVSGDGSIVRGVLLSDFPASLTSEFATSLTNRYFPPSTTINSVEANAGDRIVIEIGFRSFNTTSTIYYGYFRYGDSSSTDLPIDETTTSDDNPWLEFSADLEFAALTEISSLYLNIEYSPTPQTIISNYHLQVEYTPAPGPVLQGSINLSCLINSVIDLIIYDNDAQADFTIAPIANYEFDISFEGQVSCQLQINGEFEFYSLLLDGTIAVEVVPTSLAYQTLQLYDGSIDTNITPTSEAFQTLFIYEGLLPLTIQPTSIAYLGLITNVGLVNIQLSIAGTVDIPYFLAGDLRLSLEVSHLEYMVHLGGALSISGESSLAIAWPNISAINLLGGIVIGAKHQIITRCPQIDQFRITGSIAIQGTFQYLLPRQDTILASVYRLAGGVYISGFCQHQIADLHRAELTTSHQLELKTIVGDLRLPPVLIAPAGNSLSCQCMLKGGLCLAGTFCADSFTYHSFSNKEFYGGISISGYCTFLCLTPPIFEHQTDGILYLFGSLFDDDVATDTWVLSGYALSPSYYTNYPFNSYCLCDGQVYAAGPEGIYVLDGLDDHGVPIITGVRIGPTNFGIENLKRLRAIYPLSAGNIELRVQGHQTGREAYYQLGRNQRFECGREVQDREFILDLQGFDELSHLEIRPLVLMQR